MIIEPQETIKVEGIDGWYSLYYDNNGPYIYHNSEKSYVFYLCGWWMYIQE